MAMEVVDGSVVVAVVGETSGSFVSDEVAG